MSTRGTSLEYKSTFNLASAAGQLITTVDKMNPSRGTVRWSDANANFYRPAVSPSRKLAAVNVTFSSVATQTFRVSILDQDGTARIIASADLVAASQGFFEPEHDICIGSKENFQVDVTNNGTPAITGTITLFCEEV